MKSHNPDSPQYVKPLFPEEFYQVDPRQDNTYDTVKHRRSWTDSHETYQNAARQQYHLLMANYREGNHEIVIGYLKEYSIQELLDQFSLIKEYLKQEGIIAYYVVEITRDKFGNPVNRIHYHFLIDCHCTKDRLIGIFKDACQYAGLEVGVGKDCRVLYKPIPDSETFERKCRYILKYQTKKLPILFQSGTGINKIGTIGHWFTDSKGSRVSKKKYGSQSLTVGIRNGNQSQLRSD